MTTAPSGRTQVFISYSHEDRKYLEQLQVHLRPYARSGAIVLWDDTKIKAGTRWREEINKALQSAKVAILLVSATYLASDFIVEHELPPLLAAAKQDGATILSVILSPCAFDETELAEFQAVNPPSKPASGMRKDQREALWARTAKLAKEALTAQLPAPPIVNPPVDQSVPVPEAATTGQANSSQTRTAQQGARSKYTTHIEGGAQGVVQGDQTHVTMNFGLDPRQVKKQIDAQIAFDRAQEATEWQKAVELVQRALDLDPDLEGARSFIGIRLCQEVVLHFQQESMDTTDRLSLEIESRRAGHYPFWPDPPRAEQVTGWLETALEHQENPQGEVSAALALMYGYSGAYGEMIPTIKEALALNPALITYFQRPEHLATLAYACSNNRRRIEDVGELLGLSLPASKEAIRTSFEAIDMKNDRHLFVDWFAVEQVTIGKNTRSFPATVRIFRLSVEDLEKPTYGYIFRGVGPVESFPSGDEASLTDKRLSIDLIIDELMSRFFFICPKSSSL